MMGAKAKDIRKRNYMNSRRASSMILGLWVALLLPASSSATVVYPSVVFTNFGPGLSYNYSVGDPVGNAFDGSTYAEGDTFTLPTSTVFGDLQIALSCSAACPDAFTVALTKDSGSDSPGAVIESFTVQGASLGAIGQHNTPLVLDSSSMPTLTAGTQYWVTVSSDLSDSIAWNLNTTGDMSDQAISTDGGTTWFSPSGLTPGAYEIDAVPEPRTIVLLAGAMLLLWPARRYTLRRRC